MASFNKVILMGNLTRDPDVRATTGGMTIVKLGLAMNHRFTTSTGEAREETCFVDVDVFGKQADSCRNYLHKGSPVLVEGMLRTDSWQDKNTGEKRSKLVVRADRVQFLSSPGSRGFGDEEAGGEAAPGAPAAPPPVRRAPMPGAPVAAAPRPQAPPPVEAESAAPAAPVDDIPF